MPTTPPSCLCSLQAKHIKAMYHSDERKEVIKKLKNYTSSYGPSKELYLEFMKDYEDATEGKEPPQEEVITYIDHTRKSHNLITYIDHTQKYHNLY